MKTFRIFLVAGAFILTATSAHAVKAIDDGSKFGTGEDSIRCLEQVSLLSSYYKIKAYDDAYNSFKIIYDECPQAAGRTLYNNGAFLIKYKMSQEKDKAKKQDWFKLLMECYEKRIQYFGNDKKYPESYIRGRQAIDYIELSGDPNMLDVVLPWLEMSITDRGSASEAAVVDYYFRMKEKQYQSDTEKYKESFINDFLKVARILEGSIVLGEEKTKDAYKATLSNVNSIFVKSGAADCATLDGVFASKVEANTNNVVDLTAIIKLYKGANCTESDVYFSASAKAHKLNPSSETAAGCGYQAIKKEEYAQALDFFNEAITLLDESAENDSIRYDYQYIIAGILMTQDKYADAKAAALKAIQYAPNQGKPYIALARMYADPKHNPYSDDKILAKTVYWAAVDKLEKAKAVDPDCAEEAQALINQFRKYYPTKEDVFFKPELKVGETFHIGGWINESVRCRD
ncbi:MAG: hypothetical protein MJ007_06035 [Paludibacteraceae bacterium]|nr:hypothetical protein [Paludibacteraceae bacterium]